MKLGRISRDDLEAVASEYGVSKMEDLYAALGYGKFSARQVLQKVAPEDRAGRAESAPAAHAAAPQLGSPDAGRQRPDIKVKGIDDLLVYRAKCCNPIRGEQIVGYVTRGKGVAVHSDACPNVQNLMYEVERKIEVEWARSARNRSRSNGDSHRRPPGHVESADVDSVQRIEQHPQPGSARRPEREPTTAPSST